jgi:outer membrane autotransporter protein
VFRNLKRINPSLTTLGRALPSRILGEIAMTIVPSRLVRLLAALLAVGLTADLLSTPAAAQILGTAEDFGVLAGSTTTNTGPSVIQGNVGVSPGSALIGFPPGVVVPPGTIHVGDAVASQAQVDLTTAYNTLMGRPAQVILTGQDLGGLFLGPAVYAFAASAQLTGVLTLNGQGNSAAEFVFQIGSSLTTASNSAVLLINGANGNNVYWAVGSSATLGSNSVFAGNIVALTSITLNTGASITCGRALARNGAVTLDNNTITLCVPTTGGSGGTGGTGGTGTGGTGNGGNDIPISVIGGAGVTGTQETALGASHMFGSAMLGQATLWREGQDQPPPQNPVSLKDGTAGSMSEEQWLNGYHPRTHRVWATGFGGTTSLDGEASNNSADLDTRSVGFAAGLDYQIDHTTLVGIAGGYTNSTFSVSDQLTNGTVEGGHIGLYGVKRLGAFYLAGTAEYAHFSDQTDRSIDWVIDENAQGSFSSDAFGGRVEAGWTKTYGAHNVTPFIGMDVMHLSSDGFTENSQAAGGGAGILGLTFGSNSVTSVTSVVGVQIDTRIALANGGAVTPFVRVAWAHEFNPDRSLDSFLTSSPAATFSVDGAPAASDAARVNAGLKVDVNDTLAVYTYFDGAFSDRSQGYAGNGGLKISW